MNKLDLMEALIAIADNGSIQQAAIKLHQTNAALSQKLSKLEAHLATQLIKRDRKGLVLTEAGQRYYHEAKKAIEQFNLAERSILHENTQPQGELKIAANPYFSQTIILPKLAAFSARYPDLFINIDVAEILPCVNLKRVHVLYGVAFRGHDDIENLVRKKIATTKYVLCASPVYLKKNVKPNTTAELLQHDFISHSARKYPEIIILDDDKQIVLKPKLLLNNTQQIINAALEGLGFIWVHEYMVSDLLANKKLMCLLENQTKEPVQIYAYYEYQPYRDPKIQAFMDFFA